MSLAENSFRTTDASEPQIQWPRKSELLGVQMSAVTYDEAVEAIFQSARRREPAQVSMHAVHALVTASRDPDLRRKVNTFHIVAPDGQPVRWAMNLLHGCGLRERVYGPELMLRLCRRAAEESMPVYLYGSVPPVLDKLCANLESQFPGLPIAGAESPPFRQLTAEESEAVVERINGSGAGIVFIGLGAPKQDHFAYDFGPRIRAAIVCVGAAFDFHAGTKRMAPRWMQRCGLEWLYRLSQEPGRLWRRYLVTNSQFVANVALALVRRSFTTGNRKDNVT